MALDVFTSRLADIEIFRGLTEARLTRIARAAERMVFRPGQSIIEADASGDAAFLVIGGEAAITVAPGASPARAEVIVEGTLLGEMAMLIEHDYAVSVVARSPVRCLKLSRQAMHHLMAEDPQLAEHFVARVTSRLTRVAVELRRIDQMLALAAETSPQPA